MVCISACESQTNRFAWVGANPSSAVELARDLILKRFQLSLDAFTRGVDACLNGLNFRTVILIQDVC